MLIDPSRRGSGPIELGLNLPYVEESLDGRTPRWTDVKAMAQTAESIGFDAVWISDHVAFSDPERDWRGSWDRGRSWPRWPPRRAGWRGARTSWPFRSGIQPCWPKMAETLDEVSGGRPHRRLDM